MAFDVAALTASLRPLAAQYRPDSYDIRREGTTSDGAGGSTATTSVVESGTAILVVSRLRGMEVVIGGERGATDYYELRNMPWNTLVTPNDTVVVAGRIFEVVEVIRLESARVSVTAKLLERV